MKYLTYILFLIVPFQTVSALEEKTIHVEGATSGKGNWMEFSNSEEMNLKKLFDLLTRSQTGEKLLKDASKKAGRSGLTLTDVVKVGEISLTDTTLVRKFNPHSPENVIYESKSIVYINKNLAWDDALLDLSHELTHFIYRESFNPYAEEFNAKDFIKGTIEGEGGEVQAFITECRVFRELFSKNQNSRSHCSKIVDDFGQLSYRKAIELFYHVGPYYEKFHEQLSKRELASSFTDLKADKINFISSALGVPYPVAALMEYDLVMNKVCENDKKRLAYMQQKPDGTTRAPASSALESKDKFQASYRSRCSSK